MHMWTHVCTCTHTHVHMCMFPRMYSLTDFVNSSSINVLCSFIIFLVSLVMSQYILTLVHPMFEWVMPLKFLKITLCHMKNFFRPHSLRIYCRNFALSSIYWGNRLLFVWTLHLPALTSSCAKRVFQVYSCDAYHVTVLKVKLAVHTYTGAYSRHTHPRARTHAHRLVC